MKQWLTAIVIPGLFIISATAAIAQSSHSPDPGAPVQQAKLPPLDPHPVVALTFDDLPAVGKLPPNTTRTQVATNLATELNANHLTGTYGFVNASKLDNDPDAQQSLHVWLDAGMNIGSHTWSHMSLTSNTAEAFKDDIARNEPALAQYAGKRDWHWFRYPFLWEGDTLEKRRAVRSYLRDHGYRVAQVSLDFEDYAWNDAYARCVAKQDSDSIQWLRQSYLETATEYIRLGREEQQITFGHEIPNVMLLHATAFTTLMLPDLLNLLRSQGFTFAPLAKVESDPAYALDPDAPPQIRRNPPRPVHGLPPPALSALPAQTFPADSASLQIAVFCCPAVPNPTILGRRV